MLLTELAQGMVDFNNKNLESGFVLCHGAYQVPYRLMKLLRCIGEPWIAVFHATGKTYLMAMTWFSYNCWKLFWTIKCLNDSSWLYSLLQNFLHIVQYKLIFAFQARMQLACLQLLSWQMRGRGYPATRGRTFWQSAKMSQHIVPLTPESRYSFDQYHDKCQNCSLLSLWKNVHSKQCNQLAL